MEAAVCWQPASWLLKAFLYLVHREDWRITEDAITSREIAGDRQNGNVIMRAESIWQTLAKTLKLSNEVRKLSDINDIILKPGEEKELEWIFPKFIDDQDASQAVILSSVRVMEKYSGTEDVPEEVRKSEIDNAIAKFSMEAVIVEK